MGRSGKGKKLSNLQFAVIVSIGTFFTAAFVNLTSQSILNKITQLYIAIGLLLAVIFLGIIFDIIGVAVAVADDAPFHARVASFSLRDSRLSYSFFPLAKAMRILANPFSFRNTL